MNCWLLSEGLHTVYLPVLDLLPGTPDLPQQSRPCSPTDLSILTTINNPGLDYGAYAYKSVKTALLLSNVIDAHHQNSCLFTNKGHFSLHL